MRTTNNLYSPFFFICLSVLLFTTTVAFIYPISAALSNVISLCSIALFFLSLLNIKSAFIYPFRGIDFIVFFLFLCYIVSVLFRAENLLDYSSLLTLLKNRYSPLAYTTPIIFFLGIKNIDLQTLFKIIYFSCLIGLFYIILHFNEIFLTSHVSMLVQSYDENRDDIIVGQTPALFALPSAFLLFSYKLIPKKYLKVSWLVFILSLFTSVVYGRRSYIAFHIVYLIIMGYVYFFSKNGSRGKKFFLIFSLIIFSLILFFSYSDISYFTVLANRAGEDTRSGVEDYFYEDFEGKTIDWIFGRGIDGTYYCPAFKDNPNRSVIETGYLQIILKGGIVFLIFYLFFLLKAAYLGFFRSNNMLGKTMSLFLLANVIFLVSGNTLEFSLRQIIIWVSVLFCFNNRFRIMDDESVYNMIKK